MYYIRTIDTNQDIASGSIIMFNSQPDEKWMVQYGVYNYAGQPNTGWYAKAIISGAILPLDPATFSGITLISSPITPAPYPPGPRPPHPGPKPPGPDPRPFPYYNDGPNWITVDTVAERDRIAHHLLVDGKVVRVNNYNGHPEYFEWDEESHSWHLWNLGPRFSTAEDVQEQIEDLKKQTDTKLEDIIAWVKIGANGTEAPHV